MIRGTIQRRCFRYRAGMSVLRTRGSTGSRLDSGKIYLLYLKGTELIYEKGVPVKIGNDYFCHFGQTFRKLQRRQADSFSVTSNASSSAKFRSGSDNGNSISSAESRM